MPVRIIIKVSILYLIALSAACGNEIGDECSSSIDCSPDGDRICLRQEEGLPGGYCSVFDCDYDSCPDESVCVRFFSAVFPDSVCDPDTEDLSEDRCTADEFCTLGGTCAPALSEVRYCMKRCGSNGDCRGGYECRDRDGMIARGGEPLRPPGTSRSANPPRFCAVAP